MAWSAGILQNKEILSRMSRGRGRGVEGKIEAIRHARENKVPFLGICLGMQLAVVEFARNVCGLAGAHSAALGPPTFGILGRIDPFCLSLIK